MLPYRILENTDLREMTTFRLHTPPARLIVYADSGAALPELHRRGMLDDALLLGGGSNMLFTGEQPLPTVIHPLCREIAPVFDGEKGMLLEVEAGVELDELCRLAAESSLWGTENLSGIPGHVGGAAVQNAGAYGTEMKDIIVQVKCFRPADGTFLTLSAEECSYGYRDSIFKHQSGSDRLIICSVTIRLYRTPRPNLSYKGLAEAMEGITYPTPMDIRKAVLALRDAKLPRVSEAGSAGSFFKNPVVSRAELHAIEQQWGAPVNHHLLPDGNAKLSAAWLIDRAGCKSLTSGSAILWPTQPLVIANIDYKATASDIISLERQVIDRVREAFGVRLTPEVIHI